MTNPSTDQRRPEEKIKVFISHRHEDKETADALLQALISIGIPKSNIYSSSNAKTKTKAGYKYKEDLVKFLWECHVVFFLYSSPEKDWSYCSYEIGVANEESVETKIIPILLANQDSPSFIQDVQAIKVKGDQELTKAEFFELINNCFGIFGDVAVKLGCGFKISHVNFLINWGVVILLWRPSRF